MKPRKGVNFGGDNYKLVNGYWMYKKKIKNGHLKFKFSCKCDLQKAAMIHKLLPMSSHYS